MKKMVLVGLVYLCMTFMFTACGAVESSDVEGKYYMVLYDEPEECEYNIEFDSSGTCTYYNLHPTLKGSWTMDEETKTVSIVLDGKTTNLTVDEYDGTTVLQNGDMIWYCSDPKKAKEIYENN